MNTEQKTPSNWISQTEMEYLAEARANLQAATAAAQFVEFQLAKRYQLEQGDTWDVNGYITRTNQNAKEGEIVGRSERSQDED